MADEPELLLTTSRFRVVRHRHATPHGGWQTRETIEHPGAVTILPLLEDGRVCLIRNFRVAVGATLLELPAGTLSPDENPLLAAQRELAEETGYTAREWSPLAQFWMSPGILRERMHLFLAVGLTAGPQGLMPDEEIATCLFTWQEALDLAARGEIQDAKTLTSLLLYDRFHRQPK